MTHQQTACSVSLTTAPCLRWGTLVIMALMKLFLGLDSLMTTQSVMALLGMPCSSTRTR